MPFTFKLSKRLAQMHAGDQLRLVADDLLAVRPVPPLSVSLSHSRCSRAVSPSEKLREGLA
jgi:TusA-related sulfurtransferase